MYGGRMTLENLYRALMIFNVMTMAFYLIWTILEDVYEKQRKQK